MKRNAIVLASIVAALLAAGCGKHVDVEATGEGASIQPAGFEPAGETTHAVSDSAEAFIGPPYEPRGAVSADSLPPDISVSAPDTPVIPGNPVEIIAHGTPDVAQVVLWDGIGQKQLMTFDSEGKVWRVFYRVPLRASRDRLELSVTAKNGANKWRRVWVSLIIQREVTEAKPEPAYGS
jgi:hypothetical protein